MYNADYHSIYLHKIVVTQKIKFKLIRIADNIFIGTHYFILKGVTIKRVSVIKTNNIVLIGCFQGIFLNL